MFTMYKIFFSDLQVWRKIIKIGMGLIYTKVIVVLTSMG